jgi:two-component system OmpR family sensor kinase
MGALKDKAKLDDAMSRIESEALRMSGLVENLLALARLEEHKKLEKSKIDLLQVCLDSIKDAAAANPGLKFKLVNLEGEPFVADPPHLNAELNSIKQVLVNLLSNASRFAGDDKSIEVALGQDKANTIIEVRDHGEGIPVELRQKVFERFYRADNSRNRETGGNGLGLAIVKAMVDAHGGTIEAVETVGGGATFRVTLPNA